MRAAGREGSAVDLDRDLIPFTNVGATWLGHHSRFGLFWPYRELPGLQALGCIAGTKNHILTEGLLRWRVFVNGEEQAPGFPQHTYYPWAVLEECDYGPMRLAVWVAYVAADAIICRFATQGEGRVRVEFESPWQPPQPIGQPLPRHPWPPEVYRFDTEPVPLRAETREREGLMLRKMEFDVFFFQGIPDLPNFKGLKQGDTMRACYALNLAPWEGEAGESFDRCVAFGFDADSAVERCREAERIAPDWAPEAERQRFEEMYAAAPAPKRADLERLRRHAIAGLSLTVTSGHGGFWGDRRITLAARYHIVGQWYWDTAVTMLGLREFAPEIARESALALLDNLAEDGAPPLTLTDETRHGEGQGPLLAWGVWMLHKVAPDLAFLQKVYPKLVRVNRYWMERRRAESGMCKWANAAQSGADNDARWAPCGTTDLTGNIDLSGVESPDLNAMLVCQMRSLANIAAALGQAEEAEAWRLEADEHARGLVERMYFPEDAMFWDVDEATGEPFTRARSPLNFLPLWAGVALPPHERRRVIEEHMLNPREFFGSYPFPSLAYDDPLYNPHSYWRGRMWPHVVYWMIEILWENGYEREAEWVAGRLLQIFQTTPYVHECYPSDGYDPHLGLPEYNWSLAVLLELLLERYKERPW
jgi:hypothetical protein